MFTRSPDSAKHFTEELTRARNILVALDNRLDTSKSSCDCCGQVSRNNWDEYTMHQRLEGSIGRVKRCIEELEQWVR